MAIQDQCNKCRKYGTDSCKENIVFDSTSCPNYANKINIDKVEDNENTSLGTTDVLATTSEQVATVSPEGQAFVYTREYLKQNTEIRGWLTFFLVMLILGGFFSFVYPIVTYNPDDYAGSFFLAISDPIQGLMVLGLACYTAYSFYDRQPNAVILAKTYLIVIFLINLLLVIVGNYEDKGFGSLPQLVRSLIWSVIWFLFLKQSTVVEEVIPTEYRRVKHIDYYIIAVIIIVPLLLLALGLKQIYADQEEQQVSFIENTTLGENEYTDGKIIFKCLEGFSCDKEEVQEPKITIFQLENENIASITVCSDYDSDATFSNFNSYWKNWEDESAKNYQSTEIENGTSFVNNHQYFIKTMKYDVDGNDMFWRFVLMFDNVTGKVAVASCYDGGYDDYLEPFLSTIRFQ